MEILELRELNPDSLSLFGDVAQVVYQNDPVWASASESTFARQWSQRLRQRHDIFRPVVVLTQNQPCARAVAIRTKGATGEHGEVVGFIGFFECLENQPGAARLVLDHCEQILVQAGVQSIQIPKVDNQLYGCQISDFGLPHVCLTPHNPPYYRDLFEATGYGVSQHIYSLYFTRENTDQVHVELPGFRTREFNRGRLDEEIEHFHRLQQAIFGDRSGYVPRTLSEDRDLVTTLLPIIDDDLIIIAEDARWEFGWHSCLSTRLLSGPCRSGDRSRKNHNDRRSAQIRPQRVRGTHGSTLEKESDPQEEVCLR